MIAAAARTASHDVYGGSRLNRSRPTSLPARLLPSGLMLDGELVAWRGRQPWFPDIRRRVLNGDLSVPVTFVAFDRLRVEASREEASAATFRASLAAHKKGAMVVCLPWS